MNEDQHSRRIALWLGSFPVIAAFALLTLVLLLSSRTPLVTPKTPAASNLTNQADLSIKATGLAIEPIQAESP